ncbi:MAG TPA: hypothetical protein VK009_06145 [Chloroflexota bacterium]|nr:hypothetical protein [Chloroflexota bacterium]
MKWWNNLSGPSKGWLESLAAAVLTAGADIVIQELTAGGLNPSAVNWQQAGGAALIAGLVYVRAHLQGLVRNPDGSPVAVKPPANPAASS